MSRERRTAKELTPQGGLSEAGIHRVLGYQLAQATILTTEAFVRVVGKPFDLRPVEFTILQLIRDNTPVTVTGLAKALAMTVPGVTIWLDRLEPRGLIVRERSQADRRASHLKLSREGGTLVGQALTRLLEADREMLKDLSEGEQAMLLELLHKVAAARKR